MAAAGSETVASKVPFYQLCSLLDKLNNLSGNDAKKNLLGKFIEEWREFHSRLHRGEDNTTDSFYPAMRLLLPQLERERGAYGIKETNLAKLYIEILGLGKDSVSAQKLLNYRAPKHGANDSGDFAGVAYWILKPRCPEKGSLSVQQVNEYLDEVARCNSDKDKAGVRRNLLLLLKNTSAKEQKWLIRMILKQLKMGLSQQSVFSVFHEDAEDVFNVKTSLEKVCTMLMDPSAKLHEIEISVFAAFRPMLGDRCSPQSVEKIMEGKEFIIELKYDGERMQLHKRGEEYKYFSRGGLEYTDTYGGNPFSGNLTPYICNNFDATTKSCILDGEMVGYDASLGTIGSKGERFDIKSPNQGRYQPMFCVFDVLLLNDVVMSNKPLRERRKALEGAFNPIEGRICLSQVRYGKTRLDCVEALNDAIDSREEGIMIKDPESVYKPNTRKGGWYKMKPEYVDGLMDELDLVVVGGYFGTGTRGGILSHFMLALPTARPAADNNASLPQYVSFARVGSGYNKTELHELNLKVAAHLKPWSTKSPPSWLQLQGQKQKPDVWVDPRQSFILQVKAAEIVESDQFATGCTLRFPRVEKIRYDKAWHESMTLGEMEDLRQKGKLTARHAALADGEDDGSPDKKKRRVVRSVRPTIMPKFRGLDSASVVKKSELFADKEFCVLTSADLKSSLEKQVLECGGSLVQNPGKETFCVLARRDAVSLKARNAITKGEYDVVDVGWFLHCVDKSKLFPWKPNEIIHVSAKTAAKMAEKFDTYGDSYTEEVTADELRRIFDRVHEKHPKAEVSREEIAELEEEFMDSDYKWGLFRHCRVYMDDCAVVGDTSTRLHQPTVLRLTACDLAWYGADVSEVLDDSVSHVVVNSRDVSRLDELKEANRTRKKHFHLVTESWVSECIAAGKILTERHYAPAL